MKLNRTELKKIMYGFNSSANRLMKADWQEHTSILAKFLAFIEREPLIWDYISDCGEATFDVALEIQEVANSYGRAIFDLGDESYQETANIYHILRHFVDNNLHVADTVGHSYAHSTKYADAVKGFNERVMFVLIRNIEGYLTKIGIDMGIDETIKYNITVNNGQVNIASDSAVINATVNNGVNQAELKTLLDNILAMSRTGLTVGDTATVEESVEVIESELRQEKPKKSVLKGVLTGLQVIKGSAEFGAAVVNLIQFLQPLLH